MSRWIALLPCLSIAAALGQSPASERVGTLRINRTRVTWSSPESLVRDLRSNDDQIVLRATHLLGVDEKFFAPDDIELRYVEFGPGRLKYAIILTSGLNEAFAAIAAPKGETWERFTVIGCFCQYGGEQLDHFARVDFSGVPGDLAKDLIIMARAGGTGIVVDTEVHFRLRGENLQPVFSFVSRKDAHVFGPGGGSLHERRWFEDGQLVEETATVKDNDFGDWKSIDDRNFKSKICRPYKFDDANFRYIPSGPAKACAAKTP